MQHSKQEKNTKRHHKPIGNMQKSAQNHDIKAEHFRERKIVREREGTLREKEGNGLRSENTRGEELGRLEMVF